MSALIIKFVVVVMFCTFTLGVSACDGDFDLGTSDIVTECESKWDELEWDRCNWE